MDSQPPYNPYAPPATSEVTPRDDQGRYAFAPLASREQRLGAELLDDIVLIAPCIVTVGLARALFPIPTMLTSRLSMGLGLLLGCGIELFVQQRDGRSIGKRVLKIRVVRMNGEAPSLARIVFLRNFIRVAVGYIPLVGWAFSLADAFAILGAQSRCLHDQIADTKVIRERR